VFFAVGLANGQSIYNTSASYYQDLNSLVSSDTASTDAFPNSRAVSISGVSLQLPNKQHDI
jgi:hypothetical protein